MERKASKQTRIALIVLIVFLLASILSLSFAWFTDKKESTSNITFGNILLDVTGASAGENGELKFNITRNEVTTTTNSKVMPGDIVNIDLTVGLKTNSQPAYYLLKLTDKTNKVFQNSIYFSDGTVDNSNNLIVYQTDGETSWEQNDETKTTTKMVGKITNSDKHNISIKAEISRDYEEENSKTEIICDIYAIQQANLTESEAKNYLLAGLNSNVPLEYTEVEYLEATGTQYIDTGLKATNKTGIEAEFEVLTTSSNYLLGTRQGAEFLLTYSASGHFAFDYKGNSRVALTKIGDKVLRIKVKKITGQIVSNVVSHALTESTFETTRNMYICAESGASNAVANGSKRVYSVKIFEDNVLMRNYIPCTRNSDSKPGLYDTVGRKFYTNIGTGEFNTGDIVLPSDYTKKDYIQATGAQYIDTGVNISPTVTDWNVEMSIMWTNTSTRQLMGYNTSGAGYFGITNSSNYEIGTVRVGVVPSTTSYDHINWGRSNNKYLLDVNGTKIETGDNTSGNIQLFALRGSYRCSIKMQYCKISANGKLVRNFVPCVRKSDGKAGMYDMVTKNFFVNSGTGADFITN